MRTRYFWPNMFKYIKHMCKICPGCAVKNRVRNRGKELVYSFPIDAPMKVLHVDIYTVGTETGLEDSRYHLIAACGMTAFAVCESTTVADAKTFAAALMKIHL